MDDEKIRKYLAKAANDGVLYGYVNKKELLAWLEKVKFVEE